MLTLADGNAAGCVALNQLDSSELYYLYEAWIDRQEMITQAQKKATKKR